VAVSLAIAFLGMALAGSTACRRGRVPTTSAIDPAEVAVHHDATALRLDLDAALATLQPEVRLCVVLAYSEGLSHPEIVTLTGLPLGTTKSHITRGAARLREILAEYGERS
jgi:DNA-directed RNA polymerase specialized sigma24 family protein